MLSWCSQDRSAAAEIACLQRDVREDCVLKARKEAVICEALKDVLAAEMSTVTINEKLSASATECLQEASETYITEWFVREAICAGHRKCLTLDVQDARRFDQLLGFKAAKMFPSLRSPKLQRTPGSW